jgi:hypothetical protein
MIRPLSQLRFYQRWTAIGICLVVGEVALALWFDELVTTSSLTQTGLPVSTILGTAAILGILASLVIFRTPHDGQTEL